MEPNREESQNALKPSAGQKPKRFCIVKLEERIAPRQGGNGTKNGCSGKLCTGAYCPPW